MNIVILTSNIYIVLEIDSAVTNIVTIDSMIGKTKVLESNIPVGE